MRTEVDFLNDCSDETRRAWIAFFEAIQQVRAEIEAKTDRVSVWLDFHQEAGVSVRLRHPSISHLSHEAPLLWGFPTRCGYPDVLQTRLDRMLEVGMSKRQCDSYLTLLNKHVGMTWPSDYAQNVRADIRIVMGFKEFPTIGDLLVTFIDRLNDRLPHDARLPSLLA